MIGPIKSVISRLLRIRRGFVIDYRGFRVHLNPKDQSSADIYSNFELTGRWVHEEYEQAIISKIVALHSHAIFIDVGASYGMYSLMAAPAENTRHIDKIIAIEGSPETFKWLEKTVYSNHLKERVILQNLAVSNKDKGSVSFFSHPRYSEWNRIAETEEAADTNLPTVGSTTLNQVLRDLDWQGKEPIIVKVDIEGGESKALEGLAESLKKATDYCVIVEFHIKLLNSIGGGAMNFADQILALEPELIFEIDEGGKRLNRLCNRSDFEGLVHRLENGTELWQIMTNVALGSKSLEDILS